ncbi:hypothetical protein EGR_03031 [Echinococcus granulosus]|uniref:Uncharacterized protein n=1 Tax=Echinococcus granulosus TaxID=6210 RepID=W6UKF8_ECHGR|nr:hypothetical protein EGR_03031 [Echinococcus granulosus]EUB62010.1 hypothetical protein EGR_03031 [Echinococcus granulosus]
MKKTHSVDGLVTIEKKASHLKWANLWKLSNKICPLPCTSLLSINKATLTLVCLVTSSKASFYWFSNPPTCPSGIQVCFILTGLMKVDCDTAPQYTVPTWILSLALLITGSRGQYCDLMYTLMSNEGADNEDKRREVLKALPLKMQCYEMKVLPVTSVKVEKDPQHTMKTLLNPIIRVVLKHVRIHKSLRCAYLPPFRSDSGGTNNIQQTAKPSKHVEVGFSTQTVKIFPIVVKRCDKKSCSVEDRVEKLMHHNAFFNELFCILDKLKSPTLPWESLLLVKKLQENAFNAYSASRIVQYDKVVYAFFLCEKVLFLKIDYITKKSLNKYLWKIPRLKVNPPVLYRFAPKPPNEKNLTTIMLSLLQAFEWRRKFLKYQLHYFFAAVKNEPLGKCYALQMFRLLNINIKERRGEAQFSLCNILVENLVKTAKGSFPSNLANDLIPFVKDENLWKAIQDYVKRSIRLHSH